MGSPLVASAMKHLATAVRKGAAKQVTTEPPSLPGVDVA